MNCVFIKSKNGTTDYPEGLCEWLDSYNHCISGVRYHWRKLKPGQHRIARKYCEGLSYEIVYQRSEDDPCRFVRSDFDPTVVLLFKLTWGGK